MGMLTKTIIVALKKDETILGLLGVPGTGHGAARIAAAPIQGSYALNKLTTTMIIVGTVFGETEETGYEHGILTIEIYIKDTQTDPVKRVADIAARIIALLDLKGSQLNDSYTSTVYRLRKTGFDPGYDATYQCEFGILSFEFFIKK